MPQRHATANWQGDLPAGQGNMKLGSGAYEGKFSFKTRMGDTPGTNPEELVGAALAGCFSMALADDLAQAGATSPHVDTRADVQFEQGTGGWAIARITLTSEVTAGGIENDRFQAIAEETRRQCPVAKALTGTEIQLVATLSGA